jgi:hypothetical protein
VSVCPCGQSHCKVWSGDAMAAYDGSVPPSAFAYALQESLSGADFATIQADVATVHMILSQEVYTLFI